MRRKPREASRPFEKGKEAGESGRESKCVHVCVRRRGVGGASGRKCGGGGWSHDRYAHFLTHEGFLPASMQGIKPGRRYMIPGHEKISSIGCVGRFLERSRPVPERSGASKLSGQRV